MMIFKHAFLNLIRSKSRNSLILLIMMVIALTATIALTIQTSTESLINSTLDNIQIEATIQVDREKIFASMTDLTQQQRNELLRSIPSPSLEDYELYATHPAVNAFLVTQSTALNGLDVTPVDISDSTTTIKTNGEFKLLGYDSAASMTDFTSGTATVIDGMMFDLSLASHEVIIHQSLALLNDLQVNDTLTFTNPRNLDESIALTISGIYSTTTTATDSTSPLNDASNRLLVSTATLDAVIANSVLLNPEELSTNGILMSKALTKTTTATYAFNSMADYERFTQEVENLGLDTTIYSVTSSNLSAFEASVQPLNQISQTSLSFLALTLGVGLGLLVLFQLFITKQRQYDIGVYAAIGLKKIKIGALLVMESLMLTSVAIVIGVSLGLFLTPTVTDSLLGDAIAQAQIEQSAIDQNFSRPGQGNNAPVVTNVDYVSSLDVSIDLQTLLTLMGLGLVMSGLSSSVGVFSVARFEPLQILSERG